jgi:hypothetical protein
MYPGLGLSIMPSKWAGQAFIRHDHVTYLGFEVEAQNLFVSARSWIQHPLKTHGPVPFLVGFCFSTISRLLLFYFARSKNRATYSD